MAEGTFKGWVPEAYLDEVCPPPRHYPSAWLLLGEVVRLAAFDARDDAAKPGPVLAEGERVTFYSLTHYGTLSLTIDPHGGYQAGPVPAGAKQFCVCGDPDTASDSLADLTTLLRDDGDYTGETVDVAAYTWCDGRAFALRGDAFVDVGPAT